MKTHQRHFLSVLRLHPVFSPRVALFAALLFCAAALPPSVQAGTKTWTGAVNGNFNNSGNWSGGTPVAGDDLIFPASATQFTATNNFSPNREFRSLAFQGATYVIGGNTIQITAGISSTNSSGLNTINADVDVRASHSWEVTGSLASLDINGNINLNANTLTVRAFPGDFSFSGIVSGTGNIVKLNVGTLRLDGPAANTYRGLRNSTAASWNWPSPTESRRSPAALRWVMATAWSGPTCCACWRTSRSRIRRT